MQVKIIDLMPERTEVKDLNTILSMKPFVDYIEGKVKHETEKVKAMFFQYVWERLCKIPNLDEPINKDNVQNYTEVLDLIYMTLLPPVVDETQTYWALGVPLSPVIFYGTDALYHFLLDDDGCIRGFIKNQSSDKEKDHNRLSIIYSLVFERLYNMQILVSAEIIQIIPDEKTKMNRAYKIQFDTRFINLEFKEKNLPDINPIDIHIHDNLLSNETIEKLQNIIPLEALCLEGFTVVSIQDVTINQAIENIKNIVVNLTPKQMNYDEVIESLKNLLGVPGLYMRIIPMLKVNNKLIVNAYDNTNDKVREICNRYKINEQVYMDALEKFSEHPRLILKKDLQQDISVENKMHIMLYGMGIESLAIVSIEYQKKLVGILEIYSKEKNAINEQTIAALEPAIPLLEQLLQTNIDDFNFMLDDVVKEKFTSLQPSVQWRFNEAAWHYLQNKKANHHAGMERIYFDNVYPLYGAIDVRNSTVERNLALQTDLQTQLKLLINLLNQLDKIHHLELIDEMSFKAKHYLQQITDHFTGDEEYQINRFIEDEIVSFLLHFQQSYSESDKLISDYYLATSTGGTAFESRTQLEKSLQTINVAISNLLDQMNVEIQNAYPCFFEKFRTDGVEYDIYIGQSITPNVEFHLMYLKNLRLWQLTSMAMIAKLTNALQADLFKPLQTTQLIFVHANPIDISFRNDERRFDVEGAYNIRYEVVKKRIDKVTIKNSDERLTQPDKIALVYFQAKDVEDYLSYINYLQEQNILNNDLEYLDLEDLQGVSGLKALRVGVNIQAEIVTTKEFEEILVKN